MSKSYYIPADDASKATWLNNLAAKLPNYAVALGVSTAETAAVAADALFFSYVLNTQAQVIAYGLQWTSYKNAARNGTGASLGSAPVAPPPGTPPPAVANNIFGRITTLAARIKLAPGYTESIGLALGVIGTEQTVDLNSLKPALTADSAAGQVVVGWTKQGMDGVEIEVDRGDGKGFVFLAIDTVPDYTDTQPLPAAGQSALWKYKAIYRQSDARVGQWSNVISLAVGG